MEVSLVLIEDAAVSEKIRRAHAIRGIKGHLAVCPLQILAYKWATLRVVGTYRAGLGVHVVDRGRLVGTPPPGPTLFSVHTQEPLPKVGRFYLPGDADLVVELRPKMAPTTRAGDRFALVALVSGVTVRSERRPDG